MVERIDSEIPQISLLDELAENAYRFFINTRVCDLGGSYDTYCAVQDVVLHATFEQDLNEWSERVLATVDKTIRERLSGVIARDYIGLEDNDVTMAAEAIRLRLEEMHPDVIVESKRRLKKYGNGN